MNTERAKQIIHSRDTISVHFGGKPVWIENVDEASGMATVQIEFNPQHTETVPVEKLQEGAGYNA